MARPSGYSNITGRRVLVTGGGRGIGRAIVQEFHTLGATVIVFDNDDISLQELARQLPSVKGIKVDLSDWTMTKSATETVQPIHHLINNAGVLSSKLFMDLTSEDFDQLTAINLKAICNISQVVATGMIRYGIIGGNIINVGSAMQAGSPLGDLIGCGILHSAVNAGMENMTSSMARVLSRHAIRVNLIKPGAVDTNFVQNSPENVKIQLTALMLNNSMPFPRLVEPHEIAQAVVFLCSNLAIMVAGSSLTVHGGIQVN